MTRARAAVRSSAVRDPAARRASAGRRRERRGWGVRLGLHLVKGIGEQHEALLDAELARGPYRSLADVVERTGPARGGPRAADPERGAGLAGAAAARAAVAAPRGGRRVTRPDGRPDGARASGGRRVNGGRRGPADGPAPAGRPRRRRCPRSPSRSGSAMPTRCSGSMPAPGRGAVPRRARPLGAVTNAALADRRPGRVRVGGPGRDAPAPDDGQGHGLPGARGRDRDGQRHALAGHLGAAARRGPRHALLLVDGELQREGIGRQRRGARGPVTPRGGRRGRRPGAAGGVRQLGHAGMRRLG